MKRPILLDLFAGAGGAAAGYHRAGFDVIGVDIAEQPNYPFEFLQLDVMWLNMPAFVKKFGISAVHASPPCQRYSRLRHYQPKTIESRYQDLIEPTRKLLTPVNVPWVIENVEWARHKLRNPIMLCGSMFGLEMERHRLFEVSGFELAQPEHREANHRLCARNGYLPTPARPWMTISGGKHSRAWQHRACDVMGTPWMKAGENGVRTKRAIRDVCEAVPPAYGQYVGVQLIRQLNEAVAA